MKVPNDAKIALIGVLYRPADNQWIIHDNRKATNRPVICKSKDNASAVIDEILDDMETERTK